VLDEMFLPLCPRIVVLVVVVVDPMRQTGAPYAIIRQELF